MGFAEFMGSVANIYNKVKSTVSEVYNFGKSVVHGARGAVDWIDETLDKAASIPYIGELLEEGIYELKETQIFGISWNKIKHHIDHLDNYIQAGELEGYAQMLDNAVGGAIESATKYGGEMDQIYTSQGQTQGGIMT